MDRLRQLHERDAGEVGKHPLTQGVGRRPQIAEVSAAGEDDLRPVRHGVGQRLPRVLPPRTLVDDVHLEPRQDRLRAEPDRQVARVRVVGIAEQRAPRAGRNRCAHRPLDLRLEAANECDRARLLHDPATLACAATMPGACLNIVVIAWDLAHNGASCAFVLADMLRRQHDVELVGPTFLGSEVWEPIRDAGVPIRSFPGGPLPQFVDDAEACVSGLAPDVIVACKPRFPTLLLAMLIKDQCEAPIILHIDDFELGLVGATGAVSLGELERRCRDPDVANPAGRLWSSLCESLIGGADAITVSGEPLRRRYGGVVVGQPRDELRFDPARVDRAAARAEFGYRDEDRVVLFLGSPRAHKGLRELATAVAEIDDAPLKLCVIGSFTDAGLRAAVAAVAPDRIQLVDYRPFHDVPRLTAIGDLVCLAQDPSIDFVSYQTPMKLTEALAMGIPVLARETPSLMPFIEAGVVHAVGDGPLRQRITEVLADPGDTAPRGRVFFQERLCYAAALRTLERVIDGLPAHSGEVPASWERACEFATTISPR